MRRLAFLIAGFAGLNLAIFAAAPGCGNSVVEIKPGDGGGGEGGSTFTTNTNTLTDGGLDAKDALPDYDDPGCPEQPEPMKSFVCDPYDQGNGDCADGEACYIYNDKPSDPCDPVLYGSLCAFAGSGKQGNGCGGPNDCAAGFVCVITGFGTQCVQLCPLSGQSGCPDGLTCEAIDVEGFGGCL